MSKAMKFEEGKVVTNRHGHFAKIIRVKNGFIHFAGWFPKKKTAQEAEAPNTFLNRFGMARAMGEAEALTDTAEAPIEESKDESNDADDTKEGDVDPFDGVTNDDMKEALKEADLKVSGNRAELIERCKENGIEFEVEAE